MPLRPIPAPIASAAAPRKRRLWLLVAPWTLALLLFAALCAAWFVLRGRVDAALDAAEASARGAGVELRLADRRIDGFPFRLRVRSGPVRLALRSGWVLEAPALTAQAFTYNPLHWVFVAPQGLTVVRPQGGPVRVSGSALRASVSGVRGRPWRVALVGEELSFSTPAGARPFSLVSAGRLALYLKPARQAPGDGAVLLDVAEARAARDSMAWSFAPEAPINAAVEGRLTRLSAFGGRDWGAAVRAWRDAGGALELGHVEALGGITEVWAVGGRIVAGADGRLEGAVPLRMRQAARLIEGPAGAQTITVQPLARAAREVQGADAPLTLERGEIRLGPVVVSASPKVG